jgi:hypothetical protein
MPHSELRYAVGLAVTPHPDAIFLY